MAPAVFYDEAHKFIGAAAVLDPRSPQCRTTHPLQAVAFKKYTIAKFFESYFDRDVQKEGSPIYPSAMLKCAIDECCAPVNDDDTDEVTYVKEAAVQHISQVLGNSYSDALIFVTAARFSDASFQLSVCGCFPTASTLLPLPLYPTGAAEAPRLRREWRLDLLLYEPLNVLIALEMDGRVGAIAVANASSAVQKLSQGGRHFTGTSSSGAMNAIILPSVLSHCILLQLKKVRCPAVFTDMFA
jgi:hypothetical protein